MFFKIFLFIFLATAFLTPTGVFAGDPPQPSNPSNNSQTASSKLEWSAPSYSLYVNDPYRIQVDNNSDFSSAEKDYTTQNTYYTPALSEGNWYWRVKAKDSTGTWSDWSSSWSFTLTASPASGASTPQPSPSSTSNPTASPVPSSSSSSSSSGSSSSSSSSSSIFTISGIPSEINSSESFTVSVNLSLPNNPSANFYLKGAFKKTDGSNYFGLTKVSGSLIKNGSSYSSQYKITTDSSGNWSGSLEVKPDSDDSGFTGTGDYIFKVGRYTNSGSGPTWSNENSIRIVGTSSSDSPDPTTAPTISPSTSTIKTKTTSVTSPTIKLEPKIGSVAGEATVAAQKSTPSATLEVKDSKINFLPWIGAGFIIFGAASLGFIYYRSHKNEKIYHPV